MRDDLELILATRVVVADSGLTESGADLHPYWQLRRSFLSPRSRGYNGVPTLSATRYRVSVFLRKSTISSVGWSPIVVFMMWTATPIFSPARRASSNVS